MSESQTVDTPEVILTHTAASKCYRYLARYEIDQQVRNPDSVYYDRARDDYKIRVKREKHSPKWNHARTKVIVLIVSPEPDEGKYIVITQTSDHYDWNDFEPVSGLPEVRL